MGRHCSENIKMNLDNLPRLKGSEDKIDWKNSIGCIVLAECGDVIYNIEITKYDKGRLNVKIDNKEVEKPIWCHNFKKGQIGYLVSDERIREHKYNIGSIIKDEKRNLVILEQIRIKKGKHTQKGYKYRCNKDGYEGEIREDGLEEGKGCPVCCGQKTMLGANTIWDTDKWVVDRGLISEEDAKKYGRGSNKKIDVVCRNCGEVK